MSTKVKTCRKCGQSDQGKFNPSSAYYCRPCKSAIDAAYYTRNRERVRGRSAAYHSTNRERQLAQQAIYRAAHRENARAYYASWRRLNPEVRAHHNATRRARKTGNGGSHALTEWLDKCALLGNLCLYCGKAGPLTRDHKVPLSLGGTDDITNIVPACGPCNSRKHTRTAAEFLAARNIDKEPK